jgi:SAM-dependent methyltransferase
VSTEQGADPGSHASSTGQSLTGADWLDVHFEACRPEYEAMLRAVGIQPGWHVLDAGCGGRSYLPLLAATVGPAGRIASIDLAEDNIATVQQRVAEWAFDLPSEPRVGSLVDLPYEDGAFDAVWCANTSQYLTDGELATALREFWRVVRPGGLVALKEYDGTIPSLVPAPPFFLMHFYEATGRTWTAAAGVLGSPALAAWLRRAGLTQVWQRRVLAERSAPLGRFDRQFWGDLLTHYASLAPQLDLPSEDRVVWERLSNPAEMRRLLDDPDFNCCEGHIVAVGTVP